MISLIFFIELVGFNRHSYLDLNELVGASRFERPVRPAHCSPACQESLLTRRDGTPLLSRSRSAVYINYNLFVGIVKKEHGRGEPI